MRETEGLGDDPPTSTAGLSDGFVAPPTASAASVTDTVTGAETTVKGASSAETAPDTGPRRESIFGIADSFLDDSTVAVWEVDVPGAESATPTLSISNPPSVRSNEVLSVSDLPSVRSNEVPPISDFLPMPEAIPPGEVESRKTNFGTLKFVGMGVWSPSTTAGVRESRERGTPGLDTSL